MCVCNEERERGRGSHAAACGMEANQILRKSLDILSHCARDNNDLHMKSVAWGGGDLSSIPMLPSY